MIISSPNSTMTSACSDPLIFIIRELSKLLFSNCPRFSSTTAWSYVYNHNKNRSHCSQISTNLLAKLSSVGQPIRFWSSSIWALLGIFNKQEDNSNVNIPCLNWFHCGKDNERVSLHGALLTWAAIIGLSIG